MQYLFEDLDLPFLERKKFSLIETERSTKRLGIQLKGILPRLSKKRSMAERIKRRKSMERTLAELNQEEAERFPFREEDLRPESNAVVIYTTLWIKNA